MADFDECGMTVLGYGEAAATELFNSAEPDAAKGRPAAPMTHHYYKDSFHLLMYDHKREIIFRDISRWLRQTR